MWHAERFHPDDTGGWIELQHDVAPGLPTQGWIQITRAGLVGATGIGPHTSDS